MTVAPASSAGAVTVEAPSGRAVWVTAGAVVLRQLLVRGLDGAMPAVDIAGGSLTLDHCEIDAAAKASLLARLAKFAAARSRFKASRSAALVLMPRRGKIRYR
jgi:hypothetical protein